MLTAILVAVLAALFVAEAIVEVVRKDRVRTGIAGNRARYYRRSMLLWWTVTVIWCGLVLSDGRLTRANLGWVGLGTGYAGVPADVAGDFIWIVTALLLLMMVIGGIKARTRGRTGRPIRGRDAFAMLLPRTAGERWLAACLAITAGITEEVVFRGLLISAGIEVYHLPVVAAAAIALILFAGVHAYQGARGVVSVGLLGLIFTMLYLISGSILPGIIVHAFQDLVALLLVPPPTKPAADDAEKPAAHGVEMPEADGAERHSADHAAQHPADHAAPHPADRTAQHSAAAAPDGRHSVDGSAGGGPDETGGTADEKAGENPAAPARSAAIAATAGDGAAAAINLTIRRPSPE